MNEFKGRGNVNSSVVVCHERLPFCDVTDSGNTSCGTDVHGLRIDHYTHVVNKSCMVSAEGRELPVCIVAH